MLPHCSRFPSQWGFHPQRLCRPTRVGEIAYPSSYHLPVVI